MKLLLILPLIVMLSGCLTTGDQAELDAYNNMLGEQVQHGQITPAERAYDIAHKTNDLKKAHKNHFHTFHNIGGTILET